MIASIPTSATLNPWRAHLSTYANLAGGCQRETLGGDLVSAQRPELSP